MVDVLVTPAGLGAMMEGRRTWDRASGTPPPSSDEARDPSAPRPLQDAQYRYESLRSEEHTSELQSLMRISYAVFCLKKKTHKKYKTQHCHIHTSHTTKHTQQ